MDDFVSRMIEERGVLLTKVAGLDVALAAYGVAPSHQPPSRPAVAVSKPQAVAERPARSFVDRVDKFGTYGRQVIEAAISYLPPPSGAPVPTRDIVAALDAAGITVRGESKVNALSALLARSSKIKGHGRSGWTLADQASSQMFDDILGGDAAQNENEPPSGSPEDGSETALAAQ